jgi:hypothetical protein
MGERQTSSSAARIATILVGVVGLVVIYCLSAGPAYWICSDESGQVSRLYVEAYRPVIALYRDGPPPIRELIDSYLTFWGMPE